MSPEGQNTIVEALPRLSPLARDALLHCIALADHAGRVSGLWHSPSQCGGATREELRGALAELYAEGLIVGQDWPHRIVLAPEVCP